MAKIRTLGPGQLIIGEDGQEKKFDADCTKAALTPKTDTDDSNTYLDGHDEAGAQKTNWTLEATIKEDFSKDGLSVWCFDNAGKSLPFKFIPNKEGSLGFTGDALIAPVGFGGDVKKQNDQDVSFAVSNLEHYDPSTQPGTQAVDRQIAD
ncbi:hypothetical protein OZX62_01565 [Bifidobacterium sp. ESL0690]|uniref:hypothetical protein n=1 Tax=Bifidobacterium sp. ESL0690 TaxID=2983214 RepID=UPI0023F8215F|nr:hypothetical protein [Bifidobacterium sp. ESL0690]WEV47013.1 hypothetical protein OZX62_01565 [Bifidobacterium sp. ESL0690]